ncbi:MULTISPECIES: hypothetical protein [unclassified Streptomyces]|uniref:hypothetical protein n=1 Tax=unclassified Streptomyces TaxID=2593676 RepID=UPI001EFCD194|nr:MULTISPECIES: hypothetical protein [unclassified Streptomyces]
MASSPGPSSVPVAAGSADPAGVFGRWLADGAGVARDSASTRSSVSATATGGG